MGYFIEILTFFYLYLNNISFFFKDTSLMKFWFVHMKFIKAVDNWRWTRIVNWVVWCNNHWQMRHHILIVFAIMINTFKLFWVKCYNFVFKLDYNLHFDFCILIVFKKKANINNPVWSELWEKFRFFAADYTCDYE
jgi:hypothetical protein